MSKQGTPNLIKTFFFFFPGHPADTIKVRLQTQPSPPIYSSAMDCVRKLVKEEGVSNFFFFLLYRDGFT